MTETFDIISPINTQLDLESKLNFEWNLVSAIYQRIFNLFSDLTLILNLTSELELEEV